MSKAYGFIEITGVVAAINALDIMCKTADVELASWERKLGGRLVTIIVEGDVSAVTEAVNAAAQGISPEIIAEYTRIKGFRANPVAVLEDNRCNGCNMQLPAGVAVQIAKGDKIITCENCGRILIIRA